MTFSSDIFSCTRGTPYSLAVFQQKLTYSRTEAVLFGATQDVLAASFVRKHTHKNAQEMKACFRVSHLAL